MKHLYFRALCSTALGCAALGLLSACGGSSYHSMNPAPPPAAQGDSFTASVQTVVATTPDDIEPSSIETIVTTTVDDKEPEAVM
jgi:hypothetical protein